MKAKPSIFADAVRIEELWEKTFHAVPLAIFISDAHYRIIRMNRTAVEIFGDVSPDKTCYEILKESPEVCHFCPCRSSENESFYQTQMTHSKVKKTFSCTASRISDDDHEFFGVVHVLHDISRQKQIEERIRFLLKYEAIGILAEGMTHQLNNILYSITSYAELVLDDIPADKRQHKDVSEILKSANHATQLLNEMTEFLPREKDHPAPLQIQFVIDESLRKLRFFLPVNIEIKKYMNMEARPVFTTPYSIHLITTTLCMYAYESMRNRGGIIQVRLDEMDDKIKLTVNNGQNLSLIDQVKRVFKPDCLPAKPDDESIFDLTLLEEVIRSGGATFSYQCREGLDVSFQVMFPLITMPSISGGCRFTEMSQKGSEHILLVEDEADVVRPMTKTMKRLGYQVTAFENGESAFEAFSANPAEFDLVITDQTMPDLSGTELSKRILDIRPEMPIILWTGSREMVCEKEAKDIGIRKYLLKPIAKSQLATAIRQVLDQKKAKILIVDNDIQFRNYLRQTLIRAGYDVLEAGDGEEGIRMYKAHQPDLIIMDILMPKKDGKDAIYELTRDFPDIKIIAVSGGGFYGPDLVLNLVEKFGALRTLKKPIDRNLLLKTIRELIN